MEIGGVVVGQLLSPIVSSLLIDGISSNWEDFWSHSSGKFTNAQRVTRAMEKLGPTYVKFGQALASRPDIIPKSLADALSTLQDDMQPFSTEIAQDIIRSELNVTVDNVDALVESLSEEPVAAASIGQVYKGFLPNYGAVAVKVQRPGIRTVVERDAALLLSVAAWIQSIPSAKGGRLVATELVDAVDEFMSRVFEELDYRNEAANAATFARLYSYRTGSSKHVKVVVPEIIPELCTDNVLVMQWLDGTKLTSLQRMSDDDVNENLRLIETGIECTLSQLLDTGVLHADPHGGNLLKIYLPDGTPMLGYLDFGLLSTVSSQVRDALVCSVTQLVFAQDVEAVAELFGELDLLPQEVLLDPKERAALTDALNKTMMEALVYPDDLLEGQTKIPKLRFDKLLDSLTRLIPRFRFQLPPYFINNARALSTLEGIARTLNPDFNVLQVMYPYALNRLLTNPTKSPVVDATLQSLIRSPTTGRIERARISKLLVDSALLTGYRRSRVLWDILKSSGGRRLVWRISKEELRYRLPFAPKTKKLSVDGEWSPIHASRRERFFQL
jgi:predicted unusual protein kinase regulating ubiquinone biosynthesis (AarF/ABC1/UbiB family)